MGHASWLVNVHLDASALHDTLALRALPGLGYDVSLLPYRMQSQRDQGPERASHEQREDTDATSSTFRCTAVVCQRAEFLDEGELFSLHALQGVELKDKPCEDWASRFCWVQGLRRL